MIYLTTVEVVELHDMLVKIYGGLGGSKNVGQLDSVLYHIQNDNLYPTMVEKSTHLMFGIIMFHCFNDGNKRTAIATTSLFMSKNNFLIEDFIPKMEDIAIGVAQGIIKKEDLHKIIQSMLVSFGYNV